MLFSTILIPKLIKLINQTLLKINKQINTKREAKLARWAEPSQMAPNILAGSRAHADGRQHHSKPNWGPPEQNLWISFWAVRTQSPQWKHDAHFPPLISQQPSDPTVPTCALRTPWSPLPRWHLHRAPHTTRSTLRVGPITTPSNPEAFRPRLLFTSFESDAMINAPNCWHPKKWPYGPLFLLFSVPFAVLICIFFFILVIIYKCRRDPF